MLQIDETQAAWLMLIARISIAVVFLVSGVHKGVWYQKAVSEFQRDSIPLIWLTLPATIVLHLVASTFLIIGYRTQEAALALAIFTVLATLKVHAYWRLPKEQQLSRSRITTANLAIIGGLLLLAAVGPGDIALVP
ncbi:MAG: DoxX family protein [Gammaproteobacteria bacterium]|nr:DoxX family protein [Gammaproteobacteria bacterium]